MYLEKLEINGFGKMSQLTLKLEKGINVIYGKNESGKSTIQWFIRGMFYGLKGGRPLKDGDQPPLKKYKPWTGNSFGGSIEYKVDNGCQYRVDRNFDRNVVEIHDSNYNNITNSFEVSRERGILFADRQLGINDVCFDRTVLVRQQESRLDDDGSRELLNKLVNLNQTGFDDISFKKAEEALKTALKKNVGTERTSVQPIDRINARLSELAEAKNKCLEKRNLYMTTRNLLQEAVLLKESLKKSRNYLYKIKELIDSRIDLDSNSKKLPEMIELEDNLIKLEQELSEALPGQNKIQNNYVDGEVPKRRREADLPQNRKNRKKYVIIPFILTVAGEFLLWYIRIPAALKVAVGILLTLGFLISYYLIVIKKSGTKPGIGAEESIRQEYEFKMHRMQELNDRFKSISNKASLICGKQIEDLKIMHGEIDLIKEKQSKLQSDINNGIDSLITSNPDIDSDLFSPSVLDDIILNANTSWLKDSFDYEMEKCNSSENENNLRIREYETALQGFNEEYGDLQSIEEEITTLELKRSEMEKVGLSLKMALEVLTESSSDIRNDYAPKLNSLMSEVISDITDSRYTDLKGDDALSLKAVAPDSGGIRNARALSGGTIDQMYLALRLAMAKLLTNGGESLPLILDEVFSQYDDDRTARTIEYLKKEYSKGQIILFTCKSRELEIIKAVCGNEVNIIEIE
jgi:Uncharacterized conserved protein